VIYSKNLIIEGEDAAALRIDEIVTLMDWGNVQITAIDDGGKRVTATYLPDNVDFKKTVKLTWLADIPDLAPVKLVKYFDVLTKDRLEEDDDFEQFINRESKSSEMVLGDVNLRTLQKSAIIQLERRGFYIVDSVYLREDNTSLPMTLVEVPDGRVPRKAAEK
jgi:glutamyl-tRNA synthetase